MYIVVFITVPNKKQAQDIALSLVDCGLAACVNVIPRLESVFKWKGKIDRGKEYLLIAKSKKRLFPKLIRRVKSLHSYEVPEIIAVPIIAGNKDYLDWLDESTRKSR